MKILITAGPTHEPIDAVRYLANRSTGKMGAALTQSALRAGHKPTLILGPATEPFPTAPRIDVETAAQMLDAVLREFPGHDLLIMAAAVADYRPLNILDGKLPRQKSLTIECEPTKDILAAAGDIKTPAQRTIGFSLEVAGDLDRARRKLIDKKLDLIVYNPVETLASARITSVLLFADGRRENLPSRSKSEFADILIQRSVTLFS